jgi:hypothetical protein
MTFYALPRLLLLAGSVVLLHTAVAQFKPNSPVPPELYNKIASLDSALFHTFNTCDLEGFAAFFSEDIEFYHDKGGLTPSKQALVESIKNNVCGKLRRELVPGSLEVYPIPNYGALQLGTHRFYQRSADGKESAPGAPAKFAHLWQQKDGVWQITRVFSYDH